MRNSRICYAKSNSASVGSQILLLEFNASIYGRGGGVGRGRGVVAERGVGVGLGVIVDDGVAVTVAVGVGVNDEVAVAVGVGVDDGVDVTVAVGLAVGVGDPVPRSLRQTASPKTPANK